MYLYKNILAVLLVSCMTVSAQIIIPISDFGGLTSPATGDLIPVVDVSDTSMAASGATKNMTLETLRDFINAGVISIDGSVDSITNVPWSALVDRPTNLAGYGITDAQQGNVNLDALSALTLTVGKGIYVSGEDEFSLYDVTAAGRALSAVSGTEGAMIYFGEDDLALEVASSEAGRALLNNAGTASTLIGYDSEGDVMLVNSSAGGRALLANAGTANTFPYYSAANTVSLAALTESGRNFVAASSYTDMRALLNLGVGNNVTFNHLTASSVMTPMFYFGGIGDTLTNQTWQRITPDSGDGGAYYNVNVPQAYEGFPDAVTFPIMGGYSKYIAVTTNVSGYVDLTDGVIGDLPFSNLTQGTALSVLGRSANSTGDVNSISASSDHQVMRRNGSALAFGAINLASSNAVTGLLADGNISSASTWNAKQSPLASASASVSVNSQKVTNVAEPTSSTDAATKGYVDVRMPAGVVMPFAGSSAPTGYLLCYGQAVSRATYADLFDVLGTTYGAGDGSTTFNLPDLRGRAVAGKDDMGGSAANRLTNSGTGNSGINGSALGAAGGADRHAITQAQLPSYNLSISGMGWYHTSGGSTYGHLNGSGSHFFQGQGNTIPSGGGNEAHPNVQPSLILNYIIKY